MSRRARRAVLSVATFAALACTGGCTASQPGVVVPASTHSLEVQTPNRLPIPTARPIPTRTASPSSDTPTQPGRSFSEGLADWATVLTGAIALWLLLQGLRDRDRLRKDQARSQAELVTVNVIRASAMSSSVPVLVILNHSGQPVHLEDLQLVDGSESWESVRERGGSQLRTTQYLLPRSLARPNEELRVVGPEASTIESGVGGEFAILSFRDARGVRWRRRTDTFELSSGETRISFAQQRVQRLSQRHPRATRTLFDRLERMARRAASRNPEQVPRSVRAVRRLWGYWPAGERDSWLVPHGAPPVTLYEGLLVET
jgi:hypothetical protein